MSKRNMLQDDGAKSKKNPNLQASANPYSIPSLNPNTSFLPSSHALSILDGLSPSGISKDARTCK